MKLWQDEIFVLKVENLLNTADKRYMFLKILFPEIVSKVRLEGTTESCILSILTMIGKVNREAEFNIKFNEVFNF